MTTWQRFGAASVGVVSAVSGVVGVAAVIREWPAHGDAGIVIDPPRGDIPRCAELSGIAPLRESRVLWFAHQSGNGEYFFAQPLREGDERCTLRRTIGGSSDAGHTYTVYLFYLSDQDSHFIAGLAARGNDGKRAYYFAHQLPPRAEHTVRATVTRDTTPDATEC